MAAFPPLTDEDFRRFQESMRELLERSDATAVLLVEKAGHLIHQEGGSKFDTTILATLCANSFAAMQMVGGLLDESKFAGIYQQGEKLSTLMMDINENCLLVTIFPATVSVGVVRYFGARAATQIDTQLVIATNRSPGAGIDLTDLNITDASTTLRQKTQNSGNSL